MTFGTIKTTHDAAAYWDGIFSTHTSSSSTSRACTTEAARPTGLVRRGKPVALGPRYGLDADLIISATADVSWRIARLREETGSVAADLGCAREVADLDTICQLGAYERQRAVAAAARFGQGLDAVVLMLLRWLRVVLALTGSQPLSIVDTARLRRVNCTSGAG